MKTWKATGCVLLAGIFWGSMGLFVRQLNAAGLYAIDVMQLRVLASAIFVGLYLLLFDRQKLRLRPRDIWCFAGSGICSLMLFSWCYFTGMQAASLAVMAVLLYTAPVFVMLMSIVFFREKLTGLQWLSVAVTFTGLVIAIIRYRQIPFTGSRYDGRRAHQQKIRPGGLGGRSVGQARQQLANLAVLKIHTL